MNKGLILAALIAAGTAQATDWGRTRVGDYESTPVETQIDFLKRVGRDMHQFTRSTGFEVCGAIANKDGIYSVHLTTDGVPHGCVIDASLVKDGHTFTGETIHSHSHQAVLQMDGRARKWSAKYGNGQAGGTLRNDGRGGFSRADYAGGPGWLVAGGQLLHQNGPRNVTRHGELELEIAR